MTFVSKYLESPLESKNLIHYIRSDKIDPKAATLIFLHGFPENSFTWSHFLPYFATAGFNVFAPNLRGNLLSNNFNANQDYGIERMVEDMVLLLDKYLLSQAILIGHDLGGAVAWQMAEKHASRCAALVLFNSPHPGAYSKLFHTKPWLTIRQAFRAWYMYLFQLRLLPEKIMSKANGFWIDFIFKWSIRDEKVYLNQRIAFYKKSLKHRNDLKGAIATYRANVFGPYGKRMLKAFFKKNDYLKIQVPIQMHWGMADLVFENDLFYHSKKFCENSPVAYQYEAAGHWVHHEYTEEIINKIITFFLDNGFIKTKTSIDKFCIRKNYSKQLMDLYKFMLRSSKEA